MWNWLCITTIVLVFAAGWLLGRYRRKRRVFLSACRGIGSASLLRGAVFHVTVFVHQGNLDPVRRKRAEQAFAAARGFLEQQARTHGAILQFRNLFRQPFKMRWRGSRPVLHERSLRRLARRFARLFKPGPDLGLRSYFVMVFVSPGSGPAGRAVVATRRDRPPGHPEFCVCPDDADPALLAHEVLHLFGARDESTSGDPASIMQTVERPLEELAVNTATAYSVGWRDETD